MINANLNRGGFVLVSILELRYAHLTQNENAEKLANPHVVGKFGIGLKDALATFDRKGVKVIMRSRRSEMTLERSKKHGFEDLVTLQVCVNVRVVAEVIVL